MAVSQLLAQVYIRGNEQTVFTTKTGNPPPGGNNTVSYQCGSIQIIDNSKYGLYAAPTFDGPIAPISYQVGSSTVLRFNASAGYKNYQLTSTLTLGNPLPFVIPATLDCNPVYTATLDTTNSSDSSFAWAEWLYGIFRDVTTGKIYSPIYNEYYGGQYPKNNPFTTYTATGLAVSTDGTGATFSKISVPAPNHVIARSPNLYQQTYFDQGTGWYGGIFKNPLDQYYYMGAHKYEPGTAATAMLRTNTLDDPMSWRAWNGSTWTVPSVPLSDPFQGIGINPLYLGYSDYFKKFIAVTIGNLTGNYASVGNNLIVYNLSDDLVNWGLPRRITWNPACGPDHVCGGTGSADDLGAEIGSYPSIMDPTYLSQTGNSTTASNGIVGTYPWISYIKTYHSGQTRQIFAMQQVGFDQVTFNRMDSFSIRGVVGSGNQFMVLGMIIQGTGTESKQFVFRGIGPSLGLVPGYSDISNPRITLYDGAGNQLATNTGWTTLSPTDQGTLTTYGIQPGSNSESAIVFTLPPGNYTVAMDGGTGVGLIDAYDLSSTAESKVAQVSGRGYSQPGNGALIMGFFSRGDQQPVIRGTGTSTLAPAGFSPVIPNPNITVSGAVSKYNDNWGDNNPTDLATINNSGLAPGNSLESATTFTTQTPTFSATAPNSVFTNYTIQLQGTGFGLLELYNVNPN